MYRFLVVIEKAGENYSAYAPELFNRWHRHLACVQPTGNPG